MQQRRATETAEFAKCKRTAACALVASILALLIPLQVIRAATLIVPGSSPTIQGAINLATSGDTVQVSSGNYSEAINFLGKNITLRSVGGPAVTTIAAPAMTPVVIFATGEGPGAVLDGFTLTGGKPDFVAPYFGDGGGIFVSSASPTILNNIITGNVACRGAGIQVLLGSPVITGNTFTVGSPGTELEFAL